MIEAAWYITGHGFGHAVRSIEVMNAMHRIQPKIRFHIRTDVPEWIFRLHLEAGYDLSRKAVDIGTVQRTSLCTDRLSTLELWLPLLLGWSAFVEEEADWMRSRGIGIVAGDIPPVAFEAADRTGVTSVALGNFGWDWIYEPWIQENDEYAGVVRIIREAYGKAGLLLRLPAHEPMSAFSTQKDIPLIARKAKRSRRAVRQELGVDSKKCVLIALPENDRDLLHLEQLTRMKEYVFLSPFGDFKESNVVPLDRMKIWFPDLVAAADEVVSKPGYGIVAECFVNRTPLVAIPRDDFRESTVLLEWVLSHMPHSILDPESMSSGKWSAALNEAIESRIYWKDIPVSGDQAAAETIFELLE